jgi:hypothetical protein
MPKNMELYSLQFVSKTAIQLMKNNSVIATLDFEEKTGRSATILYNNDTYFISFESFGNNNINVLKNGIPFFTSSLNCFRTKRKVYAADNAATPVYTYTTKGSLDKAFLLLDATGNALVNFTLDVNFKKWDAAFGIKQVHADITLNKKEYLILVMAYFMYTVPNQRALYGNDVDIYDIFNI